MEELAADVFALVLKEASAAAADPVGRSRIDLISLKKSSIEPTRTAGRNVFEIVRRCGGVLWRYIRKHQQGRLIKIFSLEGQP